MKAYIAMMRRFVFMCILLFTLAGCSGSPLSFLTGGGPNVAANVQAGAENIQTIGTTRTVDQTIKDTTANTIEQSSGPTYARAEKVDVVKVTNIDWWMIGLLCFGAGVIFPSHREIAWRIRKRFPKLDV